MNPENRINLIKQYGAAHGVLVEALRKYPREMWHFKPSDTDWSVHEVVLHITDSEANSYVRARRIIAEPGLTLMAYDENKWASELDYQNLSTEDAVELFRWLREVTYKLIQSLPDQTWKNTAYHPEIGEITLEDWLRTYAKHVSEHIGQMDMVLEVWRQSRNS